MEENLNSASENQEERRDYAQSENKTGYSSEGRKLRPRRKVSSADSASPVDPNSSAYSGGTYHTDGGYGSRSGYGHQGGSYSDRQGSYGDHRGSYGDRQGSYGNRSGYGSRQGGYNSDRQGGSYGEHRGGYGDRQGSYGSRPSYGSRQGGSYGDRQGSYGSDRQGSYGEHRSSYGDRQGSYGSRPSYGSRQGGSYSDRQGSDRQGGSYGERRSSYGDRQGSYGSRPSYGSRQGGSYSDRQGSDRQGGSYGEHRGSYGEGRKQYGEGRPNAGGQYKSYGNQGDRKPFAKKAGYGTPKPGGFKNAKSVASKKFNRKNEPHFTESDEAGINQMISRNPQLENTAYSDNDTVKTPIKEEIRLNKFIANSGICSRREADTYIQAGVVTVNGEVVTELGTKVNITKDDVRFNGERLKGEEKVYIVMNKPKGFVTSASDPHAEKTVMDLLKGVKTRVFPVGRLDKNTTGVLMFTNDGEIAEQLTHPSFNKKKIYQVILDKALEESDREKILTEGLDLADGNIKADELEYIDAEDHRRLGIQIHSGKNRIVRRLFESIGYDVKALDRVYFASLTKKGLKKGEWRYLNEGEVNILKRGAYV